MSDALTQARDMVAGGDLEGAERVLATIALAAGPDQDRAARALVMLAERRGELGMRGQQALDDFARRAPIGNENQAALSKLQRLYEELGIVEPKRAPPPPVRATLGATELPDLDGFGPADAPSEATQKNPQPQSLAEIEVDLGLTPLQARVEDLCVAGTVIGGRYEVSKAIGRGGSATVLRVFDRELSEDAALKIFHQSADAKELARFKREVSVSRRIGHENVVKLYDLGQDRGYYYLTMELLEGSDLSHRIKAKAVTLSDSLRWLAEACRGLQAAHDTGIVHRDIKPGNLFVQAKGPLKVMDFGIAKPVEAMSTTMTGVFLGTPQYVSPEQVKGGDITSAADIYSLGIVAYQLLTGAAPFQDKELVPLLMKHLHDKPPPFRERFPAVPVEVEALVLSCLAKSPRDRPRTCADIAATLDDVREMLDI